MLGITNVSNAPSIVLKDTIASAWTSGSYNGYSYRCAIPITGVTENTIAEVTFSQAQAESGNYSSVCTTYDGGLYIYSKVNTQITIPSIIIHSIVESYYELDNNPVSGSTKAVTSGGVYDALNTITDTTPQTNVHIRQYGKVVEISFYGLSITAGNRIRILNVPPSAYYVNNTICGPGGTGWVGVAEINPNTNYMDILSASTTTVYGCLIYITN